MVTGQIQFRVTLAFSLLTVVMLQACAGTGVLTNYHDNDRTGAYPDTILTKSTVSKATFGKLFSHWVDGYIYAQPLYLRQVENPLFGTRNTVYIATSHNSVYALDADSTYPPFLWRASLGPSVSSSAVGCGDLVPEIGITSTPVIDPDTNTIYVVAKTKVDHDFFYKLHALDTRTGVEKRQPVVIQGGVIGDGVGNSQGIIYFDAKIQLNRPGLLLRNGVIYIAFASHCDHGPYHGWVFAYTADELELYGVYATTPNGEMGGIWQAGHGLAADATGIYFMSGNGSYHEVPFYSYGWIGMDASDSFVRLIPDPGFKLFFVGDWFTPENQKELNDLDWDLGSSGPLLLPGNTLLGGGKEGVLYLIDRANMGHYHKPNANLQSFKATNAHIHGSPILWDRSGTRQDSLVYVWGEYDHLKAFKILSNGLLQVTPVAKSPMAVPPGMPGGFLSLSYSGEPDEAIVWATHPLSDASGSSIADGILRAFDAGDVSKELWNSDMVKNRDALGKFAKFCPPTIADGKVFVATFSKCDDCGYDKGPRGGRLDVYGLLGIVVGPPEGHR